MLVKQGHDLLGLIVAKKTRINKNAGQLFANRLMDQDGGDRGIHPARQAANHLALADLGADLVDHFAPERGHGPVTAKTGYAMGEIAQDLRALGRMGNLGMELDAIKAAGLIGNGSKGRAF